ncbi:MAG: aspartate ammonia-lyase [Planctomycetes bacterium GWF2_41_51]|nr:MAG: aspartate ammonia-lyase [Planctomycetes bacterium GWF2_41_51]HBG25534.1 aspartate ammonia-lyase [Phycisphaerales bacterium]
MNLRKEKDLLGEMDIPADALYGIHTARAIENFPLALRPVHTKLISAFAAVKLACAKTNHELGKWDDNVFSAIVQACEEMIAGKLDQHIKVDAMQGGAGTSTNMNVNEVLANRALIILGKKTGDYDTISPIDDINLHQSTNDTYPTALKVAALWQLSELEQKIVILLEHFQQKEKEFADIIKLGRTQLQDAVLTTLGRQMSAYSDAIGRDRWRIYKCAERLRVVNLGGTAIGTGLGAPRKFIFRAAEHLKDITKLPVCRAENLIDATQNTDVFVEVSGILKALASNLLKISTDLRILSSGPDGGIGEIILPARQAGSSIMPGKVNPVIPEAVSQAAIMVMVNDNAITQACSAGNLELNQFMPLIADAILTNIQLLTNACDIFARLCVSGIRADEKRCRQNVETSTAIVTALVEKIGYKTAQEIAAAAKNENKTIRQVVLERGLMPETEFENLISPQKVTMLGSAVDVEKK